LLLIDSAVRIVCEGHQVTFQALTDNGQHLIEHLNANVKSDIESELKDNVLTLTFTQPSINLDEDSRLREASSFDALRLVQHSFTQDPDNKHALFMAGLFAYDIVANFEPLGGAEATNNCPDFV
ncbi:anthranilate synthase component I, partial [Vibrio fortis]